MAKWRRSTNSLEEFIHEECILDSNLHERRAEFYRKYNEWCGENGRRGFSKGRVIQHLENNIGLGIRHTALNGYEIFRGVGIKVNYPQYASQKGVAA
jgi:putative DNA primase/helicase